MGGDKQKKRLSATAMVGCPSREQYRVNKKKICIQRHDLEMSPNITLEWDDKKKGVVSKREQVGLVRRQLIPFLEPGSSSHNALADVLSVPKGIFDLKNLSDVLSYEVWQTHLSDEERRLLSCLLPKGLSPDAVVQALLAGENFHFGNPFMKWSSSLCLGELHPDSVLQREQSWKGLKKNYYLNLHEYHHGMIENLQLWKERWANSRYPEVEFSQDIRRATKDAETRVPPPESRFCGMEENQAATPESCSWDNKMADSSDNQISGIAQGESQQRKDLNRNFGDSMNGSKRRSVPQKGIKTLEDSSGLGNGAKYMSFVKVSKEQHARFRNSLKHAGHDLQPSSLNCVLGITEPLDLQPFEKFEEEENKKLHEYWLKMVAKDIQEGFLRMKRRQSEKQEAACFLAEEMGQKLFLEASRDDEKGFPLPVFTDGEGVHYPSSDSHKGENATRSESTLEGRDTQNADAEYLPGNVLIHNHPQTISSFADSCTMMALGSSASTHGQPKPQTSSLNGYRQTGSMDCLTDNRSEEVENDSLIGSQYRRNLNHVGIPAVQEYPFPSASNGWAVNGVQDYFDSRAVNSVHISHQELSLGSQQYMHGQTLQVFGLQADQQAKNMKKDILPNMPFFSTYTNPECNELLQSFLKDQSNLQCHHQQKQAGLHFQPGSYPVIERGRLPRDNRGDIVDPSLTLEMRQKRLDDAYLRGNIYPGGCFPIPSQDHQQALNQGWTSISPVCMAVPSEAHSNVGLTQGPRIYESGIRNGWPSFGVAVDGNHSLSGGMNIDQTLYSVISECNEFSPRLNHESVSSASSFLSSGNFSGIGRGSPSSGLCSSQPLIYSSDHQAAASLKLNNLGWIAMPPQNSRMQESFLRSWNK